MNELYIPQIRRTRNAVNGRFLNGHVPHNLGKKWSEYIPKKKHKKMLKCLSLGKGNPNIGGKNAKKVIAIKDGNIFALYSSSEDAGRKSGICSRNIRSCCDGHRKHAGGLKWFWEADNEWIELINYGNKR